MKTGWKIGTVAALGGSTMALAMVAGAGSARADELADLRANQELLSQRVDQLAQGQNPGSTGPLFSINQNPAAGAPALAGSFPRSFLIPGTETSLKISGQISEVLDYWMSGGNPNASPQNTTVGNNGQVAAAPLPNTAAKARSNGIFLQSPRESRIGFETRTPTPVGEARTIMEFDWAGSGAFAPGGTNPTSVSDNLIPRIRYAYGTLGGFLAGQATSNFSDPDGNQETLDFGGNVGDPGKVRIPQIRYTMPAWWGASFSVSAETPETDIGTPAGIEGSDAGVIPTATTSCTVAALGVATTCSTTVLGSGQLPLNIAKSTAPDLTMAFYIPQSWGHVDFSGVLRPGLEIDDGKFFAKNYIGYGGHVGFSVNPGWFGWAKDVISGHFVAGDGIGGYVNQSGNYAIATNYGAPGGYGSFGGPTTAAAAALVRATTTTEFGANIGYQHWWLPNLRSNISAGINHHQIPAQFIGAAQAGAQNKELRTAHVNLIWNPVSFVDVGIEYVFGQRITVNNLKGDENVLISKFAFRF